MNSRTASGNGKARRRSASRWMPRLGQHVQRLVHRRAGRAEVDHAAARLLARPRAAPAAAPASAAVLELVQQPLHVVDVVGPGLGVARIGVARGAAREVAPLVGCVPGSVRHGNAVAVDVLVAAEVACRLPARRRSSPCRGRSRARRPRRTARTGAGSCRCRGRSSRTPASAAGRPGRARRPRARSIRAGPAGTAARAWCRRARRRRSVRSRPAGCAWACRWTGRRAAR